MSTWVEARMVSGWRPILQFLGASDDHIRRGRAKDGGCTPSRAASPTAELVTRVRTGDVAAFEQLYVMLFPRVRRVARRYAAAGEPAEDLVHDAFLALWDRRTDLDADLDVALYLITTVRHRAYNVARHDRYVRRLEAAGGDTPGVPPGMGNAPAGAFDTLDSADLHTAVARAVDALPELQRRVVTFRWRTSLSYDAIAAELGITVKMVRLNLARAYDTLRPFLRHLTTEE